MSTGVPFLSVSDESPNLPGHGASILANHSDHLSGLHLSLGLTNIIALASFSSDAHS